MHLRIIISVKIIFIPEDNFTNNIYTTFMEYLIVFLKAVAMYFVILVTMRLMGKRQLGELQPFELAITLLIANVACIPISEQSMNLLYGIAPVAALYLVHLLVIKLSQRFIRFRKLINGRPFVIINETGINCSAIKKIRMTSNDIMSALRQSGYFSPADVGYALIETNGKISILPKNSPLNRSVPYMLISEGEILEKNHRLMNLEKETTQKILEDFHLKEKEVFLFLADKYGNAYIQPYDKPYITTKLDLIAQSGKTDD